MIRELFWMIRHVGGSLSLRKQLLSWRKDLLAWCKFWRDYRVYFRLELPEVHNASRIIYPCLGEDTTETQIEPTYFYQDSWAFERIIQKSPATHVDVGSHHKFVALLSKVVPVTMVDIRPLSLPLDSLNFKVGNVLDLPFNDGSVSSLSSLCVVEHIGLGRYGDALDPFGTEKAINELKRVLAPGGDLYISLPIDDQNTTYFNAHRSFTESYILTLFGELKVVQSRYICGNSFMQNRNSGFVTGCYHLTKVI